MFCTVLGKALNISALLVAISQGISAYSVCVSVVGILPGCKRCCMGFPPTCRFLRGICNTYVSGLTDKCINMKYCVR